MKQTRKDATSKTKKGLLGAYSSESGGIRGRGDEFEMLISTGTKTTE